MLKPADSAIVKTHGDLDAIFPLPACAVQPSP